MKTTNYYSYYLVLHPDEERGSKPYRGTGPFLFFIFIYLPQILPARSTLSTNTDRVSVHQHQNKQKNPPQNQNNPKYSYYARDQERGNKPYARTQPPPPPPPSTQNSTANTVASLNFCAHKYT